MDAATLTQSSPTPVQAITLEMIQQMIISAFSVLGLSGNPSFTSTWYCDLGASNHMTSNAQFLTNVHKYSGNLEIHIADGNRLPITATGDISSSLTNVLVFLSLATSLISVGQLVDNNCKVEFFKSGCVVQDKRSGKMIAREPKVGCVFPLKFPFSSHLTSSFVSCNFAHVDYQAWHKCLRHPNSNVLQNLLVIKMASCKG